LSSARFIENIKQAPWKSHNSHETGKAPQQTQEDPLGALALSHKTTSNREPDARQTLPSRELRLKIAPRRHHDY
jgi:hypothetical protein